MQMVNAGFPKTASVWFRKGGCGRGVRFARKPSSIEYLRRIESIGFSANFRRFNLNANTCDLWTAVSLRTIARSTAIEPKPPGREMFFLLRMAFWLGIVLV